jgi:hypothetical protein
VKQHFVLGVQAPGDDQTVGRRANPPQTHEDNDLWLDRQGFAGIRERGCGVAASASGAFPQDVGKGGTDAVLLWLICLFKPGYFS